MRISPIFAFKKHYKPLFKDKISNMKIMFASDIHGDLECAKAALDAYRREGADKLVLLGDLLYFGPRNTILPTYAPKGVIALLNGIKNELLCVRGNCDAEVDQMVLDFPMMAEYAYLCVDGYRMLLTHGHKLNKENAPLADGEILVHGHTHILCIEDLGEGKLYINPGSVTYPKENNPRSYMIYEDGIISIKELYGGDVIKQTDLSKRKD